MKKTRIAFGVLGIVLALTGCGAPAEGAEAAPFNIWPWILGLLGLAMLALAGYQTYCYVTYLRKARRRRRKNTHGVEPLTIILYAAAVVLLLLAVISGSWGAAPADPNTTTEPTTEPTGSTSEPTGTGIVTGWVDDGDSRYYMLADGTFAKGWMDMDGRRYYFQENGMTLSGWHEVEGIRRYFRPDGSMARGEEEIDGVKHFFTSTGAQVEVANPWNPVPEDYTVDLMDLSVIYATDGIQIDARIYEPLKKMMDDCNAAMAEQYPDDAPRCCVTSGYRSMEDQTQIYNNKVNNLIYNGRTQEEAEQEAATAVALPGTSEHQIGLAVDIVDTDSWSLDEFQDDLPAQKWLMEHCWEYGFILRYPEGKTDVTGIIYEPWHYRYVGTELAKELQASGLTLEEYLNNLD